MKGYTAVATLSLKPFSTTQVELIIFTSRKGDIQGKSPVEESCKHHLGQGRMDYCFNLDELDNVL